MEEEAAFQRALQESLHPAWSGAHREVSERAAIERAVQESLRPASQWGKAERKSSEQDALDRALYESLLDAPTEYKKSVPPAGQSMLQATKKGGNAQAAMSAEESELRRAMQSLNLSGAFSASNTPPAAGVAGAAAYAAYAGSAKANEPRERKEGLLYGAPGIPEAYPAPARPSVLPDPELDRWLRSSLRQEAKKAAGGEDDGKV